MATNYNSDVASYTNKQQMENSEFAVSVKPTLPLIHGVECNLQQTTLPQRYIRTGAVPAGKDANLYDYGNFQFATQNNPTQNLGELWVSYCVEFFKPQLPATIGGNISFYKTNRSGVLAAAPFGTTQVTLSNTIDIVSISNTNLILNLPPTTKYKLEFVYTTLTASAITVPNATISNATTLAYYANGTLTTVYAPPAGTVAATYIQTIYFVTLTGSPVQSTISMASTGTFPAGTSVDITLQEVDSTTTA
jgi:hypothetical protein